MGRREVEPAVDWCCWVEPEGEVVREEVAVEGMEGDGGADIEASSGGMAAKGGTHRMERRGRERLTGMKRGGREGGGGGGNSDSP